MIDIPLLTAFFAGIATFFAPCIIPILPGFFAFLGGSSCERKSTRLEILGATVIFVLGFTIVFILLGVGVNFFGKPLTVHRELFEKVGGVLLILMGVFLTGLLKMPSVFNTDGLLKRLHTFSHTIRNLLMGVVFGFAWTPCIGPILGSILFLATGEKTAFQGGLLLFVFSIGLAIPFLICGLLLPELKKVLRKISVFAKFSQLFLGGILVFLGILLFFGKLSESSGWLISKLGTGLVF